MKSLNSKNRNMLKKDMADVLSDRIKTLSNEMQDILLDDLVTAFESRLEVLDRARLNMHCLVDVAVKVEQGDVSNLKRVRPYPNYIGYIDSCVADNATLCSAEPSADLTGKWRSTFSSMYYYLDPSDLTTHAGII